MPELITSHLAWLGPPWSIWTATALVVFGAIGLAVGATFTVDGAVRIADRFHVSPGIVGLTLVAMGTSAPEFAVSLTAALDGNSDIAVSNVIGSNIFNLGFILGGVALIRPLATDMRVVWRDGSVLVLSSLAVWALFGIDLGVERSNGVLLLLGLLGYLALLLVQREGDEPPPVPVDNAPPPTRAARDIARLVGGIILIVVSAELLVEAASGIAATLGVSEWVIGMTIVAAGTSLPEFTTSLVAAVRGHHSLGLANIIGSDIFNVLGVLGLTAVIHPVTIQSSASGSLLALLGMVALAVIFMRTGWRLGRREGAILLACGLARWYLDFS